MPTTTSSMLKWDVLVTNRQGLTRDLPPGKEKWMWVPTSATLIYGERDAVLVDAFLTVEQAHAFQRLTEQFHLTQEEVAERTGKDRTTIANAVRLLKLEEAILTLLEEGRLSSGHGRALLAIADPGTRLGVAQRIARTGMTVRQVERLATRGPRIRPTASINQPDPNTKAALEELQREYGTRVLIQPRRSGKPGQLIFEYYDDSDLTRLYDQLMIK